MKTKSIVDKTHHEVRALVGQATKDVRYSSQHTYSHESVARDAFERSVNKLLHVNGWSDLSVFTADFALHNQAGEPKPDGFPDVGDYIEITLPGPMPKNWVQVVHTVREPNRVEFTVRPSTEPQPENPNVIEHFFADTSSSTFRVELAGTTLTASEIGQNESINNQEPQAGDRATINTLIAEGGWLLYQKIQWKHLTNYLVHLD